MDYQALSTLIQTHPQWPTVDDATLLTWVTEEAISATRSTLSTGAVFATIASNISEFNALTDSEKQTVRDILYIHSGEGVPTSNGAPARTLFANIFSGTQTLTDLATAISYQISRAENAGISELIRLGDIEYARTL